MSNDIENKEIESLREFLTDDSAMRAARQIWSRLPKSFTESSGDHIDMIEMAKIIRLHCPPSHPDAISGVAEGPISSGAGEGGIDD